MKSVEELYPLIPPSSLMPLAQKFRNELTAALSNQTSSLPSILNPIAKISTKPGKGIAVAIGGTNGYVSLFKIAEDQTISFSGRKIFELPKKTTREKLFHFITKNILEVAPKAMPLPIGIGLAYPLTPLLVDRFLDGKLMYMTKGRTFEGLVGKNVGQEYHKFLKTEYSIDTTVSVANDAICLLLGGANVEVAGVVGTGLNFAYWDKRVNVAPLKLSQLPGYVQNDVAVNIESKNFNAVEGNPYLSVVDKKSDDVGYSLAEKEVSGEYLYQLFNEAKKQIFPDDYTLSTTDELNDILTNAYPFPKHTTKEQKEYIQSLAQLIYHRSAQIVAIQLCGILLKINKTEGIIPIVMEGGVFWKAKNYPSLVNLYTHAILPKAILSFARLFGSSRRGIAILARSSVD